MTKKQMKNLIVKITAQIIKAVVVVAVAVAFVATFFAASLQASYKYSEPTNAEIAQNPFVVEFLSGKEAE